MLSLEKVQDANFIGETNVDQRLLELYTNDWAVYYNRQNRFGTKHSNKRQ
jgi:hypothetical protein